MKTKMEERRGYILGAVICAILTVVSFLTVIMGVEYSVAIWLLFVSALLQIIIQLRYFLHIDHTKQKRDDLQLILFSSGLMLIMIVGTLWILGNLSNRMM